MKTEEDTFRMLKTRITILDIYETPPPMSRYTAKINNKKLSEYYNHDDCLSDAVAIAHEMDFDYEDYDNSFGASIFDWASKIANEKNPNMQFKFYIDDTGCYKVTSSTLQEITK